MKKTRQIRNKNKFRVCLLNLSVWGFVVIVSSLFGWLILATVLAWFASSCQSQQPHTTTRKRTPVTVQLRYNDNVVDTLTTFYRYPQHVVTYVHECSCDATVTPLTKP